MAESLVSKSLTQKEIEAEYPNILGKCHVRYLGDPFKLLGKGETSLVFRGYHTGLGKPAAFKFVETKYLRIMKKTEDSVNELEIWKDIDQNKNIIRLYDSYRDPERGMFLAMEVADATFKDIILNSNPSRDDIIRWCFETVNGIEYLHKNRVIHRDIKPGNILMVLQDGNLVAKVADFGHSRRLTNLERSGTNSNPAGTQLWMAPEALLNDEQNKSFSNTLLLDIFSLGLVVHFGLSKGKHPFGDMENDNIIKNMLSEDAEPNVLVDEQYAAKDLLEKMLKMEPKDRPVISQVSSHCLFWNWKREKEFLNEVAIRFMGKDDDIEKIKSEVNIEYSSYYQRRNPGKVFNWMEIAKEEQGIDLKASLIYRPDVKNPLKEYMDKEDPRRKIDRTIGNEITKFLKLIRDKYQHLMEMQKSTTKSFSSDEIFLAEKYYKILLSCCPDFVRVLYRTLEFHGDKPCLQSLSKEFFPWELERKDKKEKLTEILCEPKPVNSATIIKIFENCTRFSNSHTRSSETVEGLDDFSVKKRSDGIHFTFGAKKETPKDDPTKPSEDQ